MDEKLERLDEQAGTAATRGELDGLMDEIEKLDEFASQSYYFLPSFDARSCTEVTKARRDKLAAVRARLFPPKKFRFSRPTRSKTIVDVETNGSTDVSCTSKASEDAACTLARGPGVYSRRSEWIVCDAADMAGACDFSLSQLEDCTVYLLGTCSTLHVSHVRRCRICCVPVSSSILVDDAEGCTFALAARQCRIHRAQACDVYLCTCSQPVVEHCRSVRFGPYNFELEDVEAKLHAQGLDRTSCHWQRVQDFDWVRTTPSPNWCLIPPGERIHVHPPRAGDVRTCGASHV